MEKNDVIPLATNGRADDVTTEALIDLDKYARVLTMFELNDLNFNGIGRASTNDMFFTSNFKGTKNAQNQDLR
jgi:hypothetical protein